MPGSMRARSTPSNTKIGHKPSASCAAMTSVPSDAAGATRFAAMATPKWPMNIERLSGAKGAREFLGARAQRGLLEHFRGS